MEAEIKISVSPAYPLPLASALYAIEAADGVWLCAYYGANRSVAPRSTKRRPASRSTSGSSFPKTNTSPLCGRSSRSRGS